MSTEANGTEPKTGLTYKDAGVDIDAQDEALDRIKGFLKSTRTPGVLADLGSFGGLFEPNLSGTLKSLKESGIKLGIVSNTFVNGCSLNRHLAIEGLLDHFDIKIYSYNYTFRKPDKRIFDLASEQINVNPANTLFVGDRVDNDVKGALKAGMIPVLKTPTQTKTKRYQTASPE